MIIIKKNEFNLFIENHIINKLKFDNYIKNKYNLNDYFIKDNSNKLIDINEINDKIKCDEINETFKLIIQPRLRGGNPFKVIIGPIKSIGATLGDIAKVFVLLYKAITFIIKMIIWLIQFILWFFIDFLNPINFINDFIGNILKITRLIIIGTVDLVFGIIKKAFNTVFSKLFSGSIFGWDQNTYDRKQKRLWSDGTKTNGDKCSEDDKYNKNSECYEGDKCYETPPGKIPFTIIIATILCPPIGIFMQYGISYWINILICAVLTLALYFPGLIYALVMLYC